MVASSSHNPSLHKITPKEEHVTLDRPESPNPFLPADQIEFSFDEIALTTNNEVSLLYPLHPNSKYIKEVSDFISKCCLKEAFTRALTQYKEYLCEFWYTAKTLDDSKIWASTPIGGIRGYICINTFRNALRAHYLPHSSMYVSPPSITIVEATDGSNHSVFRWENRWPGSNIQQGCQHLVLSGQWGKGKKPRAKSGLRRKQSSKHTSESNTEASKSKIGQSEKETQSSSAKDKSPSHPLPPTPVVCEMHKEVQQAAGGPTSLGATNEEGSHPHLSSDQTKSARDGLKTIHTDSGINEESKADVISKKIKLEDLSNLLKDIRYAFFTLDSLQDEPIIVSNENEEEEEVDKDKDTHATSHDVPKDTSIPHPPSPKSAQIQELMAQELPVEFLDLPSKASSVQEKLKTLDSLPSLLNKVTDTLNSFSSLGPWKIGKYLYFSLCSGTENEEGIWKELQFNLVDNSKLNILDFWCLNSAKRSVLINRSPTSEFQFHKGLKQGDPLSPFLFILVMESLHRSFSRVMEADLFKGLKINLHKSKLSGIGVSKAETDLAASIMGCSKFSPPFHYLEVKIGASMSRIISWKEVTDNISSRLSKWNIKTLSYGGRLTLLKFVLTALLLYYMSIYKAPAVVLKDLEYIRRDFSMVLI
ncbi:hypothetical protein Tco_1143418, partial [Tanacetum coccineum]